MNHHNDQEGTESYTDVAKRHVDEIERALDLRPHVEVAKEKWIVRQIRNELANVFIRTASGQHVDRELANIEEMFRILT